MAHLLQPHRAFLARRLCAPVGSPADSLRLPARTQSASLSSRTRPVGLGIAVHLLYRNGRCDHAGRVALGISAGRGYGAHLFCDTRESMGRTPALQGPLLDHCRGSNGRNGLLRESVQGPGIPLERLGGAGFLVGRIPRFGAHRQLLPGRHSAQTVDGQRTPHVPDRHRRAGAHRRFRFRAQPGHPGPVTPVSGSVSGWSSPSSAGISRPGSSGPYPSWTYP